MARQPAPRPFGSKSPAGKGGSSGSGPSSSGQGSGAQGPGKRPSRQGKSTSAGNGLSTPGSATRTGSQVIPTAVANRMARRVAIATGIPSLLGMGVFVGSYLLVSRQILDIPPSVTLLASGGFFLAGLAGLSYGVVSASWDDQPGSLLGLEQIGVNIGRIRSSLRAMRQGG